MRQPLFIKTAGYFKDHLYQGQAVLPAVEALQVLARACEERFPHIDVRYSAGARFHRFLRVSTNVPEIPAQVEFNNVSEASLTATLFTQKRARSSGITRTLEHVTVTFSATPPPTELPSDRELRAEQGEVEMEISARDLYEQLVPFGPAYQNAEGPIRLKPGGASAHISCPGLQKEDGPLGSPFPLDAALHVACAWGQRYASKVTFPVGYSTRWIVKPTERGRRYSCQVVPTARSRDEEAAPGRARPLTFDIWIHDETEGCLHEAALGVIMEDISRGRIEAPAWVRKDST